MPLKQQAKQLDVRGIRGRQGNQPFPTDTRDLDNLFEFYDRDNSGALSVDEFVDLLNDWRTQKGRITKRQVLEFMEWIDDDNNREVDRREFKDFFLQAVYVQELMEAMNSAGAKMNVQRTCMMGYFFGLIFMWCFFLFQFFQNREDGQSGMGFSTIGLLLTSIFLGLGIVGLLCVPIYHMNKDKLPDFTSATAVALMQGRRKDVQAAIDARNAQPKGPKARYEAEQAALSQAEKDQMNKPKFQAPIVRDPESGKNIVTSEQIADAFETHQQTTPVHTGPTVASENDKLNCSYRISKLRPVLKEDSRGDLEEYYREQAAYDQSPTSVPIDRPEDEHVEDPMAHYALAVVVPESARGAANRPQTAPGGSQIMRHGGVPGTMSGAQTPRDGHPRPITPGGGSRRGTGLRSGHGTPRSRASTPRSQYSVGGTRRGGSQQNRTRPRTAPEFDGFYSNSVSPDMSMTLPSRFGSQDTLNLGRSLPTDFGRRPPTGSLWADIPGYADAQNDFMQTLPSGRPISMQSNPEKYHADQYEERRRSQVQTPQSHWFNSLVVPDTLRSDWKTISRERIHGNWNN
ncbi:unnamed protein product [Amoebophrya sp. A120]|nr:unnamed protein product [Amoebophrya sp. A120]|eukprot:GSA120T00011287001.1